MWQVHDLLFIANFFDTVHSDRMNSHMIASSTAEVRLLQRLSSKSVPRIKIRAQDTMVVVVNTCGGKNNYDIVAWFGNKFVI